MPLTITDEQLELLGRRDGRAVLIEIACRFFDADLLSLPAAATFAGISRIAMEGELRSRRIPIYRPTHADLEQDLRTNENLRAGDSQ